MTCEEMRKLHEEMERCRVADNAATRAELTAMVALYEDHGYTDAREYRWAKAWLAGNLAEARRITDEPSDR